MIKYKNMKQTGLLCKSSFKLIIRTLVAIPLLVGTIQVATARENVGLRKGGSPPVINAACAAATAQTDLSVNNVRCRVLMGDMWFDLKDGVYEIPKGGGVHSIFAGSLWIGGIDLGGQLKVAAQTYRQTGNDFWPGPLDTTKASVSSEVCAAYDKHFKITRKEVETFVTSGVSTPAITDWPGNGDASLGQAHYLAPFFDKNADGKYSPSDGDYPGYDLVAGDGYGECQVNNCIPVDQLFGDETLWWVFNDKGNIHGETGGQPIGLEVRAQAFGFSTDDEINNMTFYNYRIFNRSTYQVDSCYFGVWADADLGNGADDFVGCDVQRGIGYTYNGDNDDEVASAGYGVNPPAIGIDFFRGPLADKNDGVDNDRNCVKDAQDPCEQIIMSGFMYYNNINGVPNGNPLGATHFYNYLKMKWGDGSNVKYGGDGYTSIGPVCKFMFPGTSDSHDWGLGAASTCSTTPTLAAWDENIAGNTPADRRMLETAGPFTLMPGAVNVITTGVVWARANAGGAKASVKLLQVVDDKAQALFDNCFKVLDGPTAPDVTIQELDKELILYLSNTDPSSNNYNENYKEFDPLISLVDSNGNTCTSVNKFYNFEGYKIYQLKNKTVSSSNLDDPALARPVYQCDIKNGISRIINYEFDQSLGAGVPKEKVLGKDLGINHSIKITTDAFAIGSSSLINHKTYFFMAVAYGYNQYKKYQQDIPPNNSNMCNPIAGASTGQKKPFKLGRKNLRSYAAIPHIISPHNGGTEMHAEYGSGPQITRIEGTGNGGMTIELTSASVSAILSASDNKLNTPTYKNGMGPIGIKVVDPLSVPDGHSFTLKFDSTNIANSTWRLTNNNTGETIKSDKTIIAVNEQLFLKWGLAISIAQVADPGNSLSQNNGFISGSMTFSDPTKNWLTGLADKDASSYSNWIRAGINTNTVVVETGFLKDYAKIDDKEAYEKIIGRSWAPYRLCATSDIVTTFDSKKYYTGPAILPTQISRTLMKELASVDVVITSDKSKWSRCVVFDLCEDTTWSANSASFSTKARKLDFRRAPSVDKNGSTATGPDNNDFSTGMGWFPGYAINVETGERLNIAFGENSALLKENGNDMKWNPTSNETAKTYNLPWDSVGQGYGSPVFGGQHYIYVFGHNRDNDPTSLALTPNDTVNVPRYDRGKRMREILGWDKGNPTDIKKREIFVDAMWVNIPLLASSHSLLESDATIQLRVSKPYKYGYSSAYWVDGLKTFYADTASVSGGQNKNLPMYTFNTNGLATHTNENDLAVEALDQIRVVPNPYYAYSNYEKSNLDNRVKITNLPESCTVSIYNLSGTLIKRYKKGEIVKNHAALNAATVSVANDVVITTWDGSLDWDLKNTVNVPIASGVYIIHVEVPGVGEKIVKWFGVMRPIDLDSF
jgi:hypothetical protein